MIIIVAAAGVTSLVCWIMVLIKIFGSGSIGLGILGIICPLFAFIYGWMKVDEYRIRNLMLIWSVAAGIGFLSNFFLPHAGMATR